MGLEEFSWQINNTKWRVFRVRLFSNKLRYAGISRGSVTTSGDNNIGMCAGNTYQVVVFGVRTSNGLANQQALHHYTCRQIAFCTNLYDATLNLIGVQSG